ncbi:MAG: SLC13 family permease, partial [Anaerolineae bacterium]
MTFPQVYVLLILFGLLVPVFLNRLREDVAALLMVVLLGGAQVLGMGILGSPNTPDDAVKAIAGFGTPEVITLMALFIITYCLDKYGVTRWLATRLIAIGGNSERRLIALFAAAGAVLSLFMNTLAAGALLLPSALDASRRTGIKPSKLLIPIAYGTMLGGAATYLTTANIIISGLLPLANPPQQALGIFDFTPTGGVVALAGLVFLALFGKYLLPDREPPAMQITPQGSELTKVYQLQERLWQGEVARDSKLLNQRLDETDIENELGLTVLGIRRKSHVIPIYRDGYHVQAGDVLLIVGREDRIVQLKDEGIRVTAYSEDVPSVRETLLAEVIVPPRSAAEGKTLQQLTFRAKYGFTPVALWRDQRSYRTDVSRFELKSGDTLLLLGPPERIHDLRSQQDFVLMKTAAGEQALDLPRVLLTLAIAVGALTAMFLGAPVELAMLTGAALLLLLGLIKPDEAYSAIKWRAIFLVAGTMSISVAMVQTQLAQLVGGAVVNIAAPFGAMGLVAGAYLLSAALTQVMGGQISPLVVGPITISAAIHLGVNPQAIAVVTAIAGSISYITPLSHPVNILMIAPANYKFSDFVRSGWILTIICFIAL